jgi:hypothetical protein
MLPDSVSCDQYKVKALSLVGVDSYAQYQQTGLAIFMKAECRAQVETVQFLTDIELISSPLIVTLEPLHCTMPVKNGIKPPPQC